LVKILARREGGTPSLAEVRAEVRLDYLEERKTRATQEFLRSLRGRYHVVIDDGPAASPPKNGDVSAEAD
jgi:hypothetical protein